MSKLIIPKDRPLRKSERLLDLSAVFFFIIQKQIRLCAEWVVAELFNEFRREFRLRQLSGLRRRLAPIISTIYDVREQE